MQTTPMGALGRGLVAGAAGAWVQTQFFRATKNLTPETPPEAFVPPDALQREEVATQTVARRFVEGFMRRGPLEGAAKERAGVVVHYGFGALWGALYGLNRESWALFEGPRGATIHALRVWAAADNVILPAFKLAAWPRRYPLQTHAYAIAAHLAYGAGVWVAYELLRPATYKEFGALAAAAIVQWRVSRRLPKVLRRPVGGAVFRAVRAAKRASAAEAIGAS